MHRFLFVFQLDQQCWLIFKWQHFPVSWQKLQRFLPPFLFNLFPSKSSSSLLFYFLLFSSFTLFLLSFPPLFTFFLSFFGSFLRFSYGSGRFLLNFTASEDIFEDVCVFIVSAQFFGILLTYLFLSSSKQEQNINSAVLTLLGFS